MPPAPSRLLVIAIDRLPAWILPPYGATWVAMPTLTALSGRGLVFDRVLATTDDAQATLSDLIGGLAGAHVVTDAPWLMTATQADGVALPAAMQIVEAVPKAAVEAEPEATSLARLCAAAADAVARGSQRIVVHAAALGIAWDAPEDFVAAYQDPDDPPPPPGAAVPDFVATADTDPDLLVGIRHVFAAQLTLLDRCLAALLDAAGDGPWTVLVVGLRGIGLGLHGRVGAGDMPPYGELIHLPAILVDARGRMAAQRFGGLVTPADLAATVRELVEGSAMADVPREPWQGVSLARLLDEWSPAGRDRVVTTTRGGAAIVTRGWQAIAPAAPTADATAAPAVRLYAKPDDFFELCDVADRCPHEVEELGSLLAAVAAGDLSLAWTIPLSPAAEQGQG
jgi:arylsulfatase A-like enzyme